MKREEEWLRIFKSCAAKHVNVCQAAALEWFLNEWILPDIHFTNDTIWPLMPSRCLQDESTCITLEYRDGYSVVIATDRVVLWGSATKYRKRIPVSPTTLYYHDPEMMPRMREWGLRRSLVRAVGFWERFWKRFGWYCKWPCYSPWKGESRGNPA